MRRPAKVAAALAALALTAAACGDDDGEEVKIGYQDFGESAILSEIYRGALDNAGIDASTVELGGFRDILLESFDSGDINLAPDYLASNLEFLNEGAGEATSDAQETLDLLQPRLEERGLVALEPSPAIDTNAFVMLPERAEELGIESLSDLADHEDLVLGAPPDCETNGFCIPGLQRVYDVDLSANFTPLDFGRIPDALDAGEIDVGVVESTNGRLAEGDWLLLEDDQGLFAADNVFPLASEDLVDAEGSDLTDALDEVSAELTSDDLTEMNRRFLIENEDAEDIAADWLEDHGFND